ncbi:hypothetical protein BH10ACT8_BH10ACT8_26540 [soil metagenome]
MSVLDLERSTAAPADGDRHPSASPPEGAPKATRSRELEGYRGVAAVTIIAFHVVQYIIAATGASALLTRITSIETVDILFVLSAYLLTLSYAKAALDQSSALPAKEFLFRRAVRILPLYWIGVTVVWSMRNSTLPGDWRDLLEHLTFTQVFDNKRIFYTLGPTWSMSLEIIFYLMLVVLGPLAVRGCARIAERRNRVAVLVAGCLVLFAIPVIWNFTAYNVFHLTYNHWSVYFGPQSRFAAFAVGMLLAVLVRARGGKPLLNGSWPLVVRVAGLAVVLVAALLNHPASYGQVAYHDLAAVGWLLLLASTQLGTPGQRWAKAFSWRPLTLLGLISYSTYMWHEPIMQLLSNHHITQRTVAGAPWMLFAVLTVSIAVGTLSYRLIEFPTSKIRALHTRNGGRRDYYPELASGPNGR